MNNRLFHGIPKQHFGTPIRLPRDRISKIVANTRIRQRQWPPENSSPLHPIEPWGKQFFVFNGLAVKDARYAGRKHHSSLPLKRDAKGRPMATETALCMTTHMRNPLIYLSRQDFETLMAHMDEIQTELKRFHAMLSNQPLDKTYELQSLVRFEKKYRNNSSQKVTGKKPPTVRPPPKPAQRQSETQ